MRQWTVRCSGVSSHGVQRARRWLPYEAIAAAYILSETLLPMTTRQAPEIFQIPLDDLDPAGLLLRGTAEFE